MTDNRQQAIEFSKQNYSRFVDEMKAFLAIPSISTDVERKPDILKAANFLIAELKKLSFDKMAIYETGGHPVVFGEKNVGNRMRRRY